MKNTLKIVSCAVAVSLIFMSFTPRQKKVIRPAVIVPDQIEQTWADAEIGVLIHFDMPVFVPEYEWNKFGTHPAASVFNPTELNTDQWLETAKKLGAKYAVLVAKHCSGFSLWPTEAHEYSVKNSPWKNGQGDIVKEFIASCKKYGIRPGIYASTSANGYLYVTNPGLVQKGGPVGQQEYNKIVVKQLTELWSNYGPLFEIWFDGGVLSPSRGGSNVLALVNKLQPNAIAFQGPFGYKHLIRWVGNEEGAAPYPCWATSDSTTSSDGITAVGGLNGRPDAPFWCPGESDFTLRFNRSFQGGWFWHANQDNLIFDTKTLMHKYVTSVGRNTNMLLGIVVDNRGLVPDADVQQITAFGNEIRRQFGTPVSSTFGQGKELTITLSQPIDIDRLILQEDISKGERVLAYTVKGETESGEWIELVKGTNIGHKHIDTFAAKRLKQVKLIIEKSKANPCIRKFSVFSVLD